MSEWAVYWRTEWKLLLRGPFLWVLLLLGAGHGWLVYSINDDIFDYGYLIHQFGFLYSMPISILTLLAGIHGARRDTALGTNRLLGSLPYRSGKLLSVRFTVTAVPFVLLGLVSSGLLLAMSAFRLEESVGLGRSLLVMVPLAAGMVYAVALGWALGTLISGRIGYVLGFAVWFVHVYLMLLVIDSRLPAPLNALFNFMLFDHKSMGFYNDLWGFLNDRTLWLHRSMYLFLTLLVLFIIWLAEKRRRREPFSRLRCYGLLGVTAALALSALAGYAAVRGERVEAFRELERQQETASLQKEQAPAFSVSRYDLKLTYSGSAVGITAGLDVGLPPNETPKELTFTLRDSFKIESAEADGKGVSFRREGSLVSLDLGQSAGKQEVKLTLTYSGVVDDWRVFHPYGNNPGNMIVPVHMVREDRVFLPGRYGWYPLPGSHRLLRVQDEKHGSPVKLQEVYPAVGLSDYRLTVDFPNSLNLFSNAETTGRTVKGGRQTVTFEGRQTDGITLLGGALKEIVADTGAPKLRVIVGGLTDEGAVKELLPLLEEVASAADQERKIMRAGPLTMMPYDLVNGYGDGRNLGGMMAVKSNLFLYRHEEAQLKEIFSYDYTSYLDQLERAENVRK